MLGAMPKKRRPRKAQHTRQPQRAGAAPALARMAPTLQLTALHTELEDWVMEITPGVTPEEAHQLFEGVSLAVVMAIDAVGLRDLFAWTPQQFSDLLDVAAAADAEAEAEDLDEPDLAGQPLLEPMVSSVMGPLFAFLVDTGRWSGTEADLDGIREILDEVSPVAAHVAALAALVADPPGGEAAQRAALEGLTMADHLLALLAWLEPGRAVTASGGLRRADLAEAAATVGVDLGGRHVRSMWDVARLPETWTALVTAGLLEVGSTSAVLTSPGRALHQDPPAHREALRAAVAAWLDVVVSRPSVRPWLPPAGVVVAPLLSLALTGGTVPEDGVAAAEQMGPARPLLDELTALGVLRPGEGVTVAPGLEAVVAGATLRVLSEATGDEMPGVDLDAGAPGGRAAPSGRALRLRIELVDARPPVRREVLLDAASVVGDLHEVVQAVFGWHDSHLHAFTGGARSREEVAERTPLTRALGSSREALVYTYDFGDDWEHRITLLGLEEVSEDVGALPRCTGATGRAPEEDSGGVWGWSDLLAAAEDPAAEEHEEAREWLGLAPGERVDPRAVDVEECDRRLARLR